MILIAIINYTCNGNTAVNAVKGPLEGIIIGSLSIPDASFRLSVIT